jgi:membrane protein
MNAALVPGHERPDAAGRDADAPQDIPRSGWVHVARRVIQELRHDHVTLLAAGVAFYAMLAMVPALIALVTVYGLVADPAEVGRQLAPLTRELGGGAGQLIREQLQSIAATSTTGLGVGLVVSLAVALWAASSGVQGLMRAVNLAYDEEETRGFLRLRGQALLLTLVGIVVAVVALALIAGVPAILGVAGVERGTELAMTIARWPVLALLVVGALGVVYRYAPDRDNPRWRWVSPGALIATVLWLIGSGLFSAYVSNFGRYDETYGSLAGVVVLLLWLYLSSFVVLLGAEINAETEHQTARDSTVGPPQPMGARGAYVADTVGRPVE